MSGLRIFIAFILSGVLFIAMGVVEEYETFFGGIIQSTGESSGNSRNIERPDDQYDIHMTLLEFNELFKNAGRNGIIYLLDELPAAENIRQSMKIDMQMALSRKLPRPIGKLTVRVMKTIFTGPDSAQTHTIEDWEYGDSISPPVYFRTYKVYTVRKINGKWIIEGIVPDSVAREKYR